MDTLFYFSEAIYGTRPWQVLGEGPTQSADGLVIDIPPAASHEFGVALKIYGVV